MDSRTLLPEGWLPPVGYANGIDVAAGRIVFIAGQVGWDTQQRFHSEAIAPQFDQALANVLAVLAEAGTGPEHVAKLTIYLAAGVDPGSAYAATRSVWGDHRTAVTVLAVTPARPGALVEIEAVAMLPGH